MIFQDQLAKYLAEDVVTDLETEDYLAWWKVLKYTNTKNYYTDAKLLG